MIEFKNVFKQYKNTIVIDDLNLEIKKGELVVLIGPSGCGKTTTLKMINQLIKTSGGQILIDNEDSLKQNPIELRRNIGYVIQHVGLIPHLTISENVGVVPKLKKWPKDKIKARVRELLELVNLDPDEFLDRYPGELSGGQKQRIGIARAFAANPEIILMDEPFSALDPITRAALQNEVYELQKEFKKTIVFVTHDMDEALELGDRICIMNEGKVVQYDTPENILMNPVNDFVKEFIGADRIASRPDLIKAKDVMIKDPFSISQRKKVVQAIDLMRSKRIDTILVVDRKQHYKGLLRLKDINIKDHGSLEISEVMKIDVITANKDNHLVEIFNLMQQEDYQSLPIINDEEVLVGLITKSNLLSILTSQYIKEEDTNE